MKNKIWIILFGLIINTQIAEAFKPLKAVGGIISKGVSTIGDIGKSAGNMAETTVRSIRNDVQAFASDPNFKNIKKLAFNITTLPLKPTVAQISFGIATMQPMINKIIGHKEKIKEVKEELRTVYVKVNKYSKNVEQIEQELFSLSSNELKELMISQSSILNNGMIDFYMNSLVKKIDYNLFYDNPLSRHSIAMNYQYLAYQYPLTLVKNDLIVCLKFNKTFNLIIEQSKNIDQDMDEIESLSLVIKCLKSSLNKDPQSVKAEELLKKIIAEDTKVNKMVSVYDTYYKETRSSLVNTNIDDQLNNIKLSLNEVKMEIDKTLSLLNQTNDELTATIQEYEKINNTLLVKRSEISKE